MIYIDPPYNTGNDFIYKDDFKVSKEEYEEELGTTDEEGGKLFRNTDSNGRFYSDWLSMMYERLIVDDGVIFISIDDNEVHNLRKICDEVFGEENCIATIANTNNPKGRSDDKYIATAHEYLLMYCKNLDRFNAFGFQPGEEILRRYNKIDENGEKYREIDLRKTGDNDLREDRPNLFSYFFYNKDTGEFYPTREKNAPNGFISIKPLRNDEKEGNWRWGLDNAFENISKLIPKYMPIRNIWGVMEKDMLNNRGIVKATSSWAFKDVNSERGSEEFISLGFDKRLFPKPKPIGTVKRCMLLSTQPNDIILDFFSGSASTAHAVMQLNAKDNGNRKFIMVQLPEKTDENSEAYKAGYKTIAEIGKERIRRAGKKIVEELKAKNQQLKLGEEPIDASKFDIGFRVYKTDDTNMKKVFYHPAELKQDLLSHLEGNIKEDRTPEDLLTQVILDLGLELSLPIETKKIFGNTVYIVQTNALVACFDNDIDFKIVDAISDLKPLKVVFKDASFKDDKDRINVEERFKRLLPETKVMVI
jgi:adenine-specific DNA-methyltransferase